MGSMCAIVQTGYEMSRYYTVARELSNLLLKPGPHLNAVVNIQNDYSQDQPWLPELRPITVKKIREQ